MKKEGTEVSLIAHGRAALTACTIGIGVFTIVLGFLYWMFNRDMDHSIKFLQQKFATKPAIQDGNMNKSAGKRGDKNAYGKTEKTPPCSWP